MRTPEEDMEKIIAGGKDAAPRVGNILEHFKRLMPEEEIAAMLADGIRNSTQGSREHITLLGHVAKLMELNEALNPVETDKDMAALTENQVQVLLKEMLEKFGIIPKKKPKKSNAAKKTE